MKAAHKTNLMWAELPNQSVVQGDRDVVRERIHAKHAPVRPPAMG